MAETISDIINLVKTKGWVIKASHYKDDWVEISIDAEVSGISFRESIYIPHEMTSDAEIMGSISNGITRLNNNISYKLNGTNPKAK